MNGIGAYAGVIISENPKHLDPKTVWLLLGWRATPPQPIPCNPRWGKALLGRRVRRCVYSWELQNLKPFVP